MALKGNALLSAMPARSPAHAAAFRRALVRWFRRYGRDLPWRRTRDPYHVMVSEFMLQQTQVSRVQSYYGRFLQRYPTLESLASASSAMVRESWEGLGYYRRAANLHRLAQEVVRDHAGVIPGDPTELRNLPGVGRYTAGAVVSFAFERPAAVVDTNVARVLRRAFHPRARQPGLAGRLWQTAERIVPKRGKSAWVFNQAIMELGALICTAREARCGMCPVRSTCATGQRGRVVLHSSPHHRSGKERDQSKGAGNRCHDPLPRAELIKVPGPVAGGIEPAEPSGGGK
jgi:A/G-specific adenine glycosylase